MKRMKKKTRRWLKLLAAIAIAITLVCRCIRIYPMYDSSNTDVYTGYCIRVDKQTATLKGHAELVFLFDDGSKYYLDPTLLRTGKFNYKLFRESIQKNPITITYDKNVTSLGAAQAVSIVDANKTYLSMSDVNRANKLSWLAVFVAYASIGMIVLLQEIVEAKCWGRKTKKKKRKTK